MLYNLKIIEVSYCLRVISHLPITVLFLFKILHKKTGIYEWLFLVRFDFYKKKIIKLNFLKIKKNWNRFKPTGFGSVWFFKIKINLARFFPICLGFFGLTWFFSGLAWVFFCLGSVRFVFFVSGLEKQTRANSAW
jgi:hypothetical protein